LRVRSLGDQPGPGIEQHIGEQAMIP
jgi:hypothetical protein